jgi:hypothetical protein
MALGFFRRNQKMVIGIMVALMVAFLVGWQGCEMIRGGLDRFIRRGGGPRTRMGRLTGEDVSLAEAELIILRELGLGSSMLRLMYAPWPTELAYVTLTTANERDSQSLAYALLLAEAKASGILVDEADVDTFFADIDLRGELYKHRLAVLRASPSAWTEGMVRRTVHDWLLINKCFAEAMVNCQPSETEIRVTYRDLKEQIDLRVMRVEADGYLKDVPEPNQAQIDAHFNLYRTRLPKQTRQVKDMGFGYRQPPRARLQYLLVRGDAIGRATRPHDDMLADYYNRNKAEFVKQVPDPAAATRPGQDANASTQPTSRPMIDVPMNFAEAKPLIIEKLRPQVVRAKMDEVVVQVEGTVRMLLEQGVDPDQAYHEARKAMTRPADKALATVLKGVKIQDERLDQAVGRLADAVGLQAIAYPWGRHDGNTLEPDLKVSLQAEGMTLGAALDEISRQVKGPKLHWATCDGFKRALFSVARDGRGVDFFPLRVRQMPLSTREELAEEAVLAEAFINPAGGQPLLQTAFSAQGLSSDPRETPMVREGASGPRMYLRGETPGRLVWRLVQAVPGHVPDKLNDDLRKQVVADLKLEAAFRKAVQDGEKFRKAAETVGIETVAGARKLETFATGLFPRRTPNMTWSNVPELGLETPEQQAHVIAAAFELMPERVEPSAVPPPPAVAAVPLPVRAEVLVMERIGFRPVVRSEYEEERPGIARGLFNQQRIALMRLWFHLRFIRQRVEYKTQ